MSSPLIQALIEQKDYPVLTEATLAAFAESHEHSVLFFTGDPAQYPESNDVAVILPELISALGGILTPALVDREDEKALRDRFGFSYWPSLVFLRRGAYLGTISKVQNWTDYLTDIERILASEPSRPPGFKVPLVVESSISHCH